MWLEWVWQWAGQLVVWRVSVSCVRVPEWSWPDLASLPPVPERGEGERGEGERERRGRERRERERERERERRGRERGGRERREREERERRAVKPSSPCRHDKNAFTRLQWSHEQGKSFSHFKQESIHPRIQLHRVKKTFLVWLNIQFSCPKAIFSKVKPTSSTSRSCWKRELGRHRPMDIFSDSRSPGLTPSLRDDSSKVVSMAVTLAGSENYKDYRKTSEKDKDTWFYQNGRLGLALLHP